VTDHPTGDLVVRRLDYLAAKREGVEDGRIVSWLAELGKTTVYTPDASVSASPPPLVRPHLVATLAHARARGATARRTRGASLSGASALSVAPALGAIVGVALLVPGGPARDVGAVLLLVYALALAASGAQAAARFHSLRVGLLQPAAVIATQAAYLVGFVGGLTARRRRASVADPKAAPPSQTA
jgi:hypothetical protein